MRRHVQFYSEGMKIDGEIFVPHSQPAGGRLPGIVICHGFSQHKEIFGLSYAESLSRHGFVCLSFDYRGFGGSEGQRGRLIPLNEVADAQSALTFLSVQPEVDPDRLGLLGTSFGGAVVLHVGAIDERAKAIVCFDGIGSGRRWSFTITIVAASLLKKPRASTPRRVNPDVSQPSRQPHASMATTLAKSSSIGSAFPPGGISSTFEGTAR